MRKADKTKLNWCYHAIMTNGKNEIIYNPQGAGKVCVRQWSREWVNAGVGKPVSKWASYQVSECADARKHYIMAHVGEGRGKKDLPHWKGRTMFQESRWYRRVKGEFQKPRPLGRSKEHDIFGYVGGAVKELPEPHLVGAQGGGVRNCDKPVRKRWRNFNKCTLYSQKNGEFRELLHMRADVVKEFQEPRSHWQKKEENFRHDMLQRHRKKSDSARLV